MLLDEEAFWRRTFLPGRLERTVSSLNQNQVVACAQELKEKEISRLCWPDKNRGQKIVWHSAHLAAIHSKEDYLRAVFYGPVYYSQGRRVATAYGRAV